MTLSEAEKEFEEWVEKIRPFKITERMAFLEAHSRQQEKIELLKEGIKKFLFRYEPDRLKAEDELQKLLDET